MASIRILTARAHRLFQPMVDELGQHLRKGDACILLVPEQLTLTAEQEIMRRLNVRGLFAVDIMSPSRLNDHVLSLAGRSEGEPLSDAGRRMAISQALERLEEQLPYYGSITLRRGFVEKLAALITDLKRGGLTPEALADYADTQPTGGPQEKLKDLHRIYQQYQQLMEGRFSDSEDMLVYVASQLEKSEFLKGKHLYVYGFDSLPEQLMQLLVSAAPLCLSLTIGLVCDSAAASDGEIYDPVRQGIARFQNRLMQKGLQASLCPLPASPLPHTAPVRHLDETLFSRKQAGFDRPLEGVYLSSGLTPYEEATLMTREVLALMKEGVSIEQIAVMYPEGYEFAVTAAMTDSGIPYYTDQPLPASNHGLVRFLLCALHAMGEGWRNRDVLGMLKSGYAPLSFQECCELENYAQAYGIDRTRWVKPFTRGDEALCQRCEALRLRLMEPLQKARAGLVAARSAEASVKAVFELLMDVKAYDTLRSEEEKLLEYDFAVRAGQSSQVWQAVTDVLDQLVRLGGKARIPLKYIATRLECGFSAVSISALPPASGMLHAGLLGHMLTEEADAVFLLGLNDGVLSRTTDSLLTPEERANAQSGTGVFLGLTDESRTRLAKLDLKRAMTLPKKYLFLSYAKTGADGSALRPLSLLDTLQTRLLPGLSVYPSDQLPMSSAQSLNRLSLMLRAYADGGAPLTEEWQRRLDEMLSSSASYEAAGMLEALTADGAPQPIRPDSARALYGDETQSVSRLEQFAACPFKHFITYGLRPHLLKEWKVDPLTTGSFYHDGLNRFAQLARRDPAFPNLSPQQVEALTDKAIAPVAEEILSGPMGDGDRNLARYELAKASLYRATQVITRQLAAGKFTLYRTEASFGYEGGLPPIVLVLSDGRQVALRGRIDRIDRYDSPDGVYLRVIDYKSSQQSLEAARTWWGLQLQLLLYLDVCSSAIPGGRPAGAFYFYVADPLLESETDAAQVVEAKLREVFYLRGISLSDVEIIQAMDGNGQVLSPVHAKNGELRKNAKALDEEQLTALLHHAREAASQLAERLFDGQVDIAPCQDSGRTACDLCDYSAVCRFDAEEGAYRQLPEMDMDQLRQKLSGENSV